VIDRAHPSADASGGPVPDVLAAIDIGTNSVHMVVARLGSEGRFEVVTKHKEVVRLGEGGDVQLKHLAPEAIDRGIAALARCRAILDTYDAPVAAVATSAVREAENRDEFLRRAATEAGIAVEVIPGHEEARLIHLGVLQALPVFDTPLVLCDIGGGSTELLVGHRGEVLAARSFKLGAIRLTRRFFPDGVTTAASLEDARRLVRATIIPFVREARGHRVEVAVGSSGTIENLAAIGLALAGEAPRSLNGAVLTRECLDEALAVLEAARTTEGRRAVAGIDASRADIIMGGAVILEQVMDALDLPQLVVSDYALREGALFDLASRLQGARADHLSDLRRRSIDHLMEVCDDDPAHSVQVARLALRLFDGLADELGLEHFDREVLEAGALLANVGMFVAHSRHHHHAYYVIRNTDHLSGFTDRETELIALVARYHRRGEPAAKHPEFARLGEEDQARVRKLAAILRVAIGLDRSHASTVADVEVRPDEAAVVLVLEPAPGADVAMERYAAAERSALLAQVTGRRVVIDAGAAPVT